MSDTKNKTLNKFWKNPARMVTNLFIMYFKKCERVIEIDIQ